MKEKLGKLQPGQRGRVVSLQRDTPASVERKLLEAGFMEGMAIEVLHVGPVGGDPIAVRVRGATVALRLSDADRIEVEI